MMNFFFTKLMMVIFLKNEQWANALVYNMMHDSSKSLDLINLKKKKKRWCKGWFLKTSGLDMSECHNLIRKKSSWVSNGLKKITRKCKTVWNCMSVRLRDCVPLGKWSVPFGTLGVPNCTWPHRDTRAMVGWLLTLFQCAFFSFFEKHLLRLWSWNTLLVSYKLSETYFKPD